MNLLILRTNIKNSLYEDGVHRADSFLNTAINEGYKLLSVMALFDERRTTLRIDGSRNFNALPTDSSAECLAPLYVANTHTGHRVNPARVQDFELYSDAWEGLVASSGDALYYTLLNPYHSAMSCIVLCPIQNIGITKLSIIGAFIPLSLSADTDIPRLAEQFHDILFHYALFYCYTSEPEMGTRAFDEYKEFVSRTNELISSIKARFPSGRDFEPWPVEFSLETITAQEQQPPKQETKNEG